MLGDLSKDQPLGLIQNLLEIYNSYFIFRLSTLGCLSAQNAQKPTKQRKGGLSRHQDQKHNSVGEEGLDQVINLDDLQ